MEEKNELNDLNKLKLNEIIQKFEKCFTMKGYKPNSTFNNKVWFLKDDQAFQSLMKNNALYSSTPKSNSTIIDLILELSPGMDLKNLEVPVDKFISHISKKIIDANVSIQMSEESIKKNDSLQKISKINEILSLLNSKVQGKRKGDFNSILQASVSSLTNFPSGPYKINLLINTSFDKENINDLNEAEKKNMVISNPDSVFNNFDEKILTTKSMINIPNDANTVTFRNNVGSNSDGNVFDEYSFGILEKVGNNYLLDRRFSGTKLSNFKLKLFGKKDTYESKNEYYLHLFLSWVDELCDLNKDVITKFLNITVSGGEDTKNEGRIVVLRFDFEIDALTRIGILNRIKELISITVDTKVKNQLLIEEILNDYFPELKDAVKNILSKKEEFRDSCCLCNAF